jgi:hypothetical protein
MFVRPKWLVASCVIIQASLISWCKFQGAGMSISSRHTEATLGGQQLEQRRAVRYRIKASVVFRWRGPFGFLQGEGVTRDINGTGAYIQTATCPPPAVTAQMEIFLPPLEPAGKSLNVTTEGQVIRVEHPVANEKLGGFAVRSKGFSIIHFNAKTN